LDLYPLGRSQIYYRDVFIGYMSDWTRKLFVERSDLFLKLMNQRWIGTDELVNGMVKVLNSFGIVSGKLLDLCCGNGRISVHMAKRGFDSIGVDISKSFIEDARARAREYNVSDQVTFREGDVRNLKTVLGDISELFDVVVSVWTSIGYYSKDDDLSVFQQARELSREGAVLCVAETTHSDFISLKFCPTAYSEADDIFVLENRKYDQATSHMSSSWAFYSRRGEDLIFIDRMQIEHHIYSLSELASILGRAGWTVVAFYGSLSTLQPMSPLTSLNIIARAQ